MSKHLPQNRPTAQAILAAQTPNGGWTKAQLAEWGVPWPPPKGWRKRLEQPEREPLHVILARIHANIEARKVAR